MPESRLIQGLLRDDYPPGEVKGRIRAMSGPYDTLEPEQALRNILRDCPFDPQYIYTRRWAATAVSLLDALPLNKFTGQLVTQRNSNPGEDFRCIPITFLWYHHWRGPVSTVRYLQSVRDQLAYIAKPSHQYFAQETKRNSSNDSYNSPHERFSSGSTTWHSNKRPRLDHPPPSGPRTWIGNGYSDRHVVFPESVAGPSNFDTGWNHSQSEAGPQWNRTRGSNMITPASTLSYPPYFPSNQQHEALAYHPASTLAQNATGRGNIPRERSSNKSASTQLTPHNAGSVLSTFPRRSSASVNLKEPTPPPNAASNASLLPSKDFKNPPKAVETTQLLSPLPSFSTSSLMELTPAMQTSADQGLHLTPGLKSDAWLSVDRPYTFGKPTLIQPPPPKFPFEVISDRVLNPAPLTRYPYIWAQTRQEVCETFEWFRSYQGGVYFTNDIAKGYLLSGFGAKRDVFAHNGRLIISHGGGRAESLHSENGKSVVKGAEDQLANDKSVRALLKTYKERRPLALIIDDKYPLFPASLASKDITYAVLGYYMIVNAWAEYQDAYVKEGQHIKYKFAFQWCEGQGEPWWASDAEMPPHVEDEADLDSAPPVKVDEVDMDSSDIDETSLKCPLCNEFSPHVYKLGRVCLQPACSTFWRLPNSGYFLPSDIEYQQDFLTMRKPCPLPVGYGNLRPPRVTERSDGITTSAVFTRGFHCDKCGRMSCRSEWRTWRCSTEGCENSYRIPSRIHAAAEFCYQPVSSKFEADWIDDYSGMVRKHLRTFRIGTSGAVGQVQTIVLPKGRGYLHHIKSHSPIAKAEVNQIFQKYQEQANDGTLNFRRWPLRAHKCRGALLTNYFSHNAGVPYHYVGGTDNTVPFDQAPSAVVDARALIRERITESLGKNVDFNEVLTAGYMEKQKMAFHSDDEKGLGPLVAGLSLGSPAIIHFRLQKRYRTSQDSAMMGEDGPEEKDFKRVLASFVLRHGDIMVMDGAGVQEYYEHTVVPTNFRIAATARFISPGLEHTQVAPSLSDSLLMSSNQDGLVKLEPGESLSFNPSAAELYTIKKEESPILS